jgi:hypothetical protein
LPLNSSAIILRSLAVALIVLLEQTLAVPAPQTKSFTVH